MKASTVQLDSVGIVAGTLCMIHCIATPFLFIAKACSSVCCADTPLWWELIDYAFLIISFIAIYFITKKSTLSWIKITFWISWFLLLLTLLNHTFMIIPTSKYLIYIPASAIIILHFYNLKFCKCSTDSCCID
tara:strand:+ start:2935 stop:3333 length:399 start_codon:yes stop_codon:yes gene_type:complete